MQTYIANAITRLRIMFALPLLGSHACPSERPDQITIRTIRIIRSAIGLGCSFRFRFGGHAVWDRVRAILGAEYRPQLPLTHFSNPQNSELDALALPGCAALPAQPVSSLESIDEERPIHEM